MSPGDSVTSITATYQGTITNPVAVKLYSSGYVDSANLADYLNVTIEEGSGGSFGSCAGFTQENTIETGGDLIAFGTNPYRLRQWGWCLGPVGNSGIEDLSLYPRPRCRHP